MVKFGSVRWIARRVIPDLYKAFGSANRALSYLREKGLGYRRKDFLADWREILDFQKKKDTWKYVPKHRKLSEEPMTPVHYDMRHKYRWVAEVTYEDKYGRKTVKNISVGFNDLVTPAKAEEQLWNEAKSREGWYQVGSTREIRVIGVMRMVKE